MLKMWHVVNSIVNMRCKSSHKSPKRAPRTQIMYRQAPNNSKGRNQKSSKIYQRDLRIKGWNLIISKDRAQIQKVIGFLPNFHSKPVPKTQAIAAAAIAEEWNVKNRPYQALS